MKKYTKITENDVLNVLFSVNLDFMSDIDCINLVNIASLKKTSRYQVKKHMDSLVRKGVAELVRTAIATEYEVMPYCGYRLTQLAVEKSCNVPKDYNRSEILRIRAMYQTAKAKHEKIVDECFGNKSEN